jgi:TRAP-type C4-dicarboxylate transport system permease large subunit
VDLIGVGSAGAFLAGLVAGLVMGLVVVPLARFWMAWREWQEASSRARFTEATLRQTGEGPWRFLLHNAGSTGRRSPSQPGDT